MKRLILIVVAIFFIISPGKSQQASGYYPYNFLNNKKSSKGSVYLTFGWHRIYYTNSTIHFSDNQTANYDFYLIKAKAIDDNDLDIGDGIDAPQYSARIGFFFNNSSNTGIELNFDHAKYTLKQGQRVHVRGTIEGTNYDKDTVLHRNFIEYEHTDGANYWMLNFMKKKNLWQSKNLKHEIDLILKPGAGLVIPRTDSRMMGWHRNDRYHISGYVAGVESGVRGVFFKNILAEITLKTVYARYNDVLLYGEGRASQHWWSFQYSFLIGFQLRTGKEKITMGGTNY
jgi:hypothetical protein